MSSSPRLPLVATFDRCRLWTMIGERGTHDRVLRIATQVRATDLVILGQRDSPKGQPVWGWAFESHLAELTERAQNSGIDVHWSTWLAGRESYDVPAAEGLIAATNKYGLASGVLDVEGEYRATFKNVPASTTYVARVLKPAFSGLSVPLGITSFASLPTVIAPVVAWARLEHDGYGEPQDYDVWQRKAWQTVASTQPGAIVDLSLRSWGPYLPKDRIWPILGVYGAPKPGTRYAGKYPDGHWTGTPWTRETALIANLEAVKRAGVQTYGLWSEESLALSSNAGRLRVLAGLQPPTGRNPLRRGLAATLLPQSGFGKVALFGGGAALAVALATGAARRARAEAQGGR